MLRIRQPDGITRPRCRVCGWFLPTEYRTPHAEALALHLEGSPGCVEAYIELEAAERRGQRRDAVIATLHVRREKLVLGDRMRLGLPASVDTFYVAAGIGADGRRHAYAYLTTMVEARHFVAKQYT